MTPQLAEWAYHTACDTGLAIAALMPGDPSHQSDAAIIRKNLQRAPLAPPQV